MQKGVYFKNGKGNMDLDELFQNIQKISNVWENKFDILDDDISQIAEILADCSSSNIVISLINTANLSENLNLKARLFSLTGLVYFAKGQFDLAEQMYLASLEINRKIPDNENMAANFDNLGILYLIQGELEQAQQMYRKALQIDIQIRHKENQAIG
jgi:tetratricopeptide (TPR) repeat protein